MLLPIIAAGLLMYKTISRSDTTKDHILNTKYLILAGFLLGIAFLYKIVAIFDFAAFLTFFIITTFGDELSIKAIVSYIVTFWRQIIIFALSFILPFLLSVIYFVIVGGLHEYIHAVFQSTVGYVGYKNAFIIPQGLLISKVLLLAIFVLILFFKRQRFSKTSLFILLWTGFSLFNCFFSQRPYTHYIIVLIPSLSLLFGHIYSVRKTNPLPYAILVVIITLTVLKYFDHWNVKGTVNYYGNFISFIKGDKSISDYDAFFDKKTVRDTELVNYINSHKKGTPSLFVWGNSAGIYPQTGTLPPGRFTVAYHIDGIASYEKETEAALKKNPPQYIITMDDVSRYPFPMYNYSQVLRIENATIYERIY
jgi:hypothetical protein